MKDVFTTRNINSDLNRDFNGGIIIYRGFNSDINRDLLQPSGEL